VSLAVLVARARELRSLLASFDPAVVTGADCATVVTELAGVEKACAAAKALAAARAASCGAHRTAGFADAGDWLAREGGTSVGAARAALETATQVESCERTKEALREGSLSLEQAGEIVRTEQARPGSEAELLAVAATSGLSTLRNRAQRRRQEAMDVERLYHLRREARHVRHWRTEIGNVAGTFELPPEIGIPFVNRLDAETDRVRRTAQQAGQTLERREAYAADAFARMVAGEGKRHATRADLVVVVDLHAFRRGHAHDDEPCSILGGGPIPVAVARDLATDAFVKAVLHDGVSIHTVAHFGRHIPAELRTALELGPAPDFDGVECIEPGCGRRYGLEWDHVDPVANHGPTSFANLKPRCWNHHRDKTELDRLAGLLDSRVASARRQKRAPP
jgi:hypothetical protein